MSDAVQHYWLNHNKILRPPLRAHLRRTRLLGQLKASLDAKLILACAEAGYGKTQLALDYLREWTSPAIWYRLDRSDQDLTQFIAYLTEALRQHFGGFGNDIQYIVSRGERDKDDLPRLLQHEMSLHVCRPLLVVLDGFETVAASAGVCRLVSELLEYSGPNVQFFITSRTVPPLPIARLEVQRETIVLGPGELAFSLEESRRLFADVRGLKASDDQVDLLWNCTDGWPAGLIMMADNLLKSPFGETDNPLNPFQGVPDSVYRYFASEVLETLSPESQEFLLRTSILTKLSHESVNSLLGIANAGELLTELKSTGAFVRDTEGDESRLRYHPLFRSFLRQKLHQRYGVDQIHEMYRRAAQAACRDGDWGTAIDYFATARDWEEVRAVMESVGEELTMRGLLETFRQWLERVPEEQIYSRPVLLMLRGRLLRLAGLYREGLRDLDRALRGFEQEGNLANGVLTQHEIAVCHYWLGEYQRAEVVLSSALRLSGDDPSLRSRILADLARNCIGFDELERGQHWGQMAVNASMVIGRGRTSSQMLVRALRFHGQALLLMGDLQRGLEEITRSVELCRLEDLGDLQCSWSLLFLGQGLSLQGSFGEAIRSLDEAEALAHGNSALLDHIRVWRGNSYRDSNALDRAERDYERCKDGAPKELALLWLREGRISDGLRLAEKAYRSSCEGESPSEKAACQVVYGLALARAADSCSGLEQLSAAAEILRARGRKQQLASVLWHVARVLLEEGRKAEALRQLENAVLWGCASGVYQLWWWDPGTIVRLWPLAIGAGWAPAYLLELARLRLGPAECPYLSEALDLVEAGLRPQVMETLGMISRGTVVREVATDLLHSCHDSTARRCIREALASGLLGPYDLARLRGEGGLTWKEIEVLIAYYLKPGENEQDRRFRSRLAGAMAVSEHTLKVHIRSIRRKLDISARRHGLPPSLSALTVNLRRRE